VSVSAAGDVAALAGQVRDLPGLAFRRLRLPDDLAPIADLHNRAAEADDIEERESAEDWAQWVGHASGWNPATDALVGELDGRIVAYGQRRWEPDNDGGRNYISGGEVDPEVRGHGIGRAILRHQVERLRELAASHPSGIDKRLETWAMDTQERRRRLIESEGFEVVRWFFEMLRPTLDDIAEMPLPEGIEIRPVTPDHYRRIWDADVEAFRDHWGGMDVSEENYRRVFSGPSFMPDLWVVAWDGDEIAGNVQNQILTELNRATGVKRGLLDAVSVRRPWRRRGLARALVAHSLRVFRDAGMTSATLGVDAQNPMGALGVYEANGFAIHRRGMDYRRQL
jgi:ribosomal protein S18 acetylase RimI-like enzyme